MKNWKYPDTQGKETVGPIVVNLHDGQVHSRDVHRWTMLGPGEEDYA